MHTGTQGNPHFKGQFTIMNKHFSHLSVVVSTHFCVQFAIIYDKQKQTFEKLEMMCRIYLIVFASVVKIVAIFPLQRKGSSLFFDGHFSVSRG